MKRDDTGKNVKKDTTGDPGGAGDCLSRLAESERKAKETEGALRNLEARYRLLFDHAPDGIVVLDPVTTRFLEFNETAHRQLGYTREEFTRLSISDFEVRESPEDTRKRIDSVLRKGREDFETVHRTKDGEIRNMHITAQLTELSGQTVYHCVWRDITDRKKAEEALRHSHQQVLDIIEFLPDPTFVIDREKRVVAWNRAIEEMTGVKKKDIIGRGDYAYAVPFYGEARPIVIDLVFERDKERIKKYDFVRTQGDILLAEVYVPMTYQGKGAYLSGIASPLFDPQGNLAGAIESIRDVTEQKRIAEELKESEERYRTAIESSNDGIAMVKRGRYYYVNRKFLEIFGFDRVDQVAGQPIGLVVHPDDRVRVTDIQRRREQGREKPRSYEFKGIRTNGDEVFIEVSATTTTFKGKPISLSYLRDITARKHLEDQLRQSQKLEAVGALAGGVAHDFNNILTMIIGYTSLLQMEMGDRDPRKAHADEILAAARKAANLTQSLLAFSRKQTIELKPYRIEEIVRGMEKLLKRLLTEDIVLTIISADPHSTIMADLTQMDQVLMNLAANARDAMPKGGSLAIETKEVELDPEFMEVHGYGEPGTYALISVTDTGCGMDRRTREKVFEPFFTTKEKGKGTGLGLSTVYGIVNQHNGYIDILSEPGKGTCFSIYLPTVKGRGKEKGQPLRKVPGGKETILVAEDNEPLRRLVMRILTGRGYNAIEAVDGEDAIAKFVENKDSIDLAILDVVMPKKNGKEACEHIKRIRPDIKVLFTSGYTGDVVLDKGVHDDVVDFISKPLSPNELLLKIREILGAGKKKA